MPPPQLLAIVLFFIVVFGFWVDTKNDNCTISLFVPLLWFLFAMSRFPSQWISLGAPKYAQDNAEGSPLDALIFFLLILLGISILKQRKADLIKLLTDNIWVCLYFCLGAISIFWSDYPFISLKRLIKAFGNVIMVLIILTEKKPYVALGVILQNLSFMLIPLSVAFIKYYPALGRAYHMGRPMFTGVTDQKNGLGQICLIMGIYFSWSFIFNEWIKNNNKLSCWISYIFIMPFVIWLFLKTDSATSTVCMAIALSIFIIAKQMIRMFAARKILFIFVAVISLFAISETLFDISTTIITMLGRRPDLTTRVPMWNDILAMVRNPITGFGYESFWLGQRRDLMYERWGITSQAHNGYLEMYINMGAIGLFFLICWIFSGLRKINRHIASDFSTGLLRFCLLLIVLVYNWTEATFYGISTMWMIFFIGIMNPDHHYFRSNYQNDDLEPMKPKISRTRYTKYKDKLIIEKPVSF